MFLSRNYRLTVVSLVLKLNSERLTVRLGLTVTYFPILRQAWEEVRPCLKKYWKIQFFQAFAFAYQNLPGSGTFDLSVGPCLKAGVHVKAVLTPLKAGVNLNRSEIWKYH